MRQVAERYFDSHTEAFAEFPRLCLNAGSDEIPFVIRNFRNTEFHEVFCFCSQKLKKSVQTVLKVNIYTT